MKPRYALAGALLPLLILAGCGKRIPAGFEGLYWGRFSGVDTTVYRNQFKWAWFWNNVILYDVRWKTESENVDILSLDDLHMDVEVALRLRPSERDLFQLHKEVGQQYYSQVVQQQFRSTARAVFAHYRYTDIPKKSIEIQNAILAQLRESLGNKHLELDAVEIKHVEYPPLVKQAADAKLATEQRLLQKDYETQIAERDTAIKIIDAKGQQRAQQIIDSTLTSTYLQYKALDVQKALVNSSNASFYFVPVGGNGIPILLETGMDAKKK